MFKNIIKNFFGRRGIIGQTPLFNIDISPSGIIKFGTSIQNRAADSLIDRYLLVRPIFRGATVFSDGRIVKGKSSLVHTYKGDIDLDEIGWRPHIHYDGPREISDIEIEDGQAYLEVVRNAQRLAQQGFGRPPEPHYTLDGFYISKNLQEIEQKIEGLENFFGREEDFRREHDRYQKGSIAKREVTRLKILENRYRRTISDQ